MMSPSKRSNSRAIGANAGEPHHPVSPRMLTVVDAVPGAGMFGGVVGTSTGSFVGGGVVAIGTGISPVFTGAVGELPPPQCVNAIALPRRRTIPHTVRKR